MQKFESNTLYETLLHQQFTSNNNEEAPRRRKLSTASNATSSILYNVLLQLQNSIVKNGR